jgi:hypothetical protein
MKNNIIKYALDKTTQKVVRVDNVPKGLVCNCICVECGSDVVAVKGNFRKWHFRHHVESNCKGGQETAIHKLAKEIIVNHNSIELDFKTLEYSEAKAEDHYETKRPDVSAIAEERPLFIEVYVRHQCEPEKKELYITKQINSFEIDLSNVSYHTSLKDLEELVLRNPTNKRIIYWHEEIQQPLPNPFVNKPIQKKKSNDNWIGWGLSLAVIAGIGFLFKKKSR